MRWGSARTACASFLVAGGEFEALIFGGIFVAGRPVDMFVGIQPAVLPATYLVAAATAVAMFWFGRSRRAAEAAREQARTETLDIDTIRERIFASGDEASDSRSRLRRLLDDAEKAHPEHPPADAPGGAAAEPARPR